MFRIVSVLDVSYALRRREIARRRRAASAEDGWTWHQSAFRRQVLKERPDLDVCGLLLESVEKGGGNSLRLVGFARDFARDFDLPRARRLRHRGWRRSAARPSSVERDNCEVPDTAPLLLRMRNYPQSYLTYRRLQRRLEPTPARAIIRRRRIVLIRDDIRRL